MDCSPPGSSVHGDAPGKNTGVGCHFPSRGYSRPRDRILVSCTAGGFFTSKPPGEPPACHSPGPNLWDSFDTPGLAPSCRGWAGPGGFHMPWKQRELGVRCTYGERVRGVACTEQTQPPGCRFPEVPVIVTSGQLLSLQGHGTLLLVFRRRCGGRGAPEKGPLDSAPSLCHLALWAGVSWADRCSQRRLCSEPPSAGGGQEWEHSPVVLCTSTAFTL